MTKTSLTFTAPDDLSVGLVSIADANGEVAKWMATPDNRVFTGKLNPGFYIAEISPAGVQPQSVVFEVHADHPNEVSSPSFASLRASSGSINFLDVSDPARAIDALFVGDPLKIEFPPSFAPARAEPARTDGALMPSLNSAKRLLRVGLSIEETSKSESYRPLAANAGIELTESRLELIVSGPDGWSPLSGNRVRLSVSIENVRLERLLLPMYRGGVQITITPSSLSNDDVELEVLPKDPRLRALVRSLVAGTPNEAKAVRPLVRTAEDILSADLLVDPWEAILSALLSIRFPDNMPTLTASFADGLVAMTPWAYDSFVIQARQRLHADDGSADRTAVAGEALGLLRKAQTCGSPYYSYANQLFAELIEALSGYFDQGGLVGLSKRAAIVRDRWLREQPLQSKAGASFSWLSRDEKLLEHGVLGPNRGPSGLLGTSSTQLFSGHIIGGSIRLDPVDQALPAKQQAVLPEQPISFDAAPGDCPALGEPRGPENDPNLGRFGGKSKVGGYQLNVDFSGDLEGEVVTVTLTVISDEATLIVPGAVAWFCLHPTFHPQWIKVVFGNQRAVLSVQAWGGFTVGVWLPEPNVLLETDLSALDGAPRVIVER